MSKDIFTDGLPEEDALGRKPFAKEIAKNIVYHYGNGSDSLVLGLSGRWGSGKSTLLEYIKEEIQNIHDQNDRYIIFEFNPWMFSNQAELQTTFLTELLGQVGDGIEGFFDQITGMLDRFRLVKLVLPSQIKEIVEQASFLLKDTRSIPTLKKEASQILVEQRMKLYVFIDDIDRLTPKEITEVFKLIKLNANFKNTIFLVAYDRDIVIQSLSEQYKADGERYLEKIIQVDYSIPEVREEKIGDLFFDALKTLFVSLELPAIELSNFEAVWKYFDLKGYFSTVRSIHRYINALRFRLPSIIGEVNIKQFLVIEAIRLFDSKGYDEIYRAYLPSMKGFNSKEAKNQLPKKIPNAHTLKLLEYLEKESRLVYHRDKAIFDPNYFETYFAFHISSSDISEVLFDQFLEGKSDRRSIVDSLIQSGKTDKFLEKLARTNLRKHEVDKWELIKSVFYLIETTPDIISRHGTLLYAPMVSLITDSTDHVKMLNSFIDYLNYGGELKYAKLYYLYILTDDIKTNFKYSTFPESCRKIIISLEEKIRSNLRQLVDNWDRHFLNKPSQFPHFPILEVFLISISWTNPEKLKEHYDILFDKNEELASLSQLFIFRNPETQAISRLYFERKELFMPDGYFEKYRERMINLDLELISNRYRDEVAALKEYFESAVQSQNEEE